MKKQKIFAALLAVCIAMASLVACNDSTKDEKTKKDKSEETEVTETTSAESDVVDESTETTETEPTETEPEIDLTLYQEGSFYDLVNHPEKSKRYDKMRELVQMINDEYPDVTMYYGVTLDSDLINVYFCDIAWGTEFLDCGYSPWKFYYWSSENDYLGLFDDEEEWYFPPVSYTYEDIMKYPVLPSDYMSLGNIGPMTWEDNVPDGEYHASVKAISLDGTKMLVLLGEPIVLTADEYYALKPGDVIDVSDQRFDFDLTVSSKFSFDEPDNLFDTCGYRFKEREDGSFVLVTCNNLIPGTEGCTNMRLAIIDVAPDCEIDDTYFSDETYATPFGYVDGPNTLTKSYYFYCHTGAIENKNIYNDWIPMGGSIYPMTVENNSIVKMVFSIE